MNTVEIVTWILLPSVMFGGATLLGFLTRSDPPRSEWQLRMFRAGHAHAGVLILMALLYQIFVRRTGYSEGAQVAWSLLLIAGNLMQSGGFFVHMLAGAPGRPSWGTRLTQGGAVVLTVAIGGLVVGLAQT
jgi:hypothetical protein